MMTTCDVQKQVEALLPDTDVSVSHGGRDLLLRDKINGSYGALVPRDDGLFYICDGSSLMAAVSNDGYFVPDILIRQREHIDSDIPDTLLLKWFDTAIILSTQPFNVDEIAMYWNDYSSAYEYICGKSEMK